MTKLILCHVTRACYVDPAFAYASGCDLATAEEHEMDIEGVDSVIHCKKGDHAAVYRNFANVHPMFWTPGSVITIMPIKRETPIAPTKEEIWRGVDKLTSIILAAPIPGLSRS